MWNKVNFVPQIKTRLHFPGGLQTSLKNAREFFPRTQKPAVTVAVIIRHDTAGNNARLISPGTRERAVKKRTWRYASERARKNKMKCKKTRIAHSIFFSSALSEFWVFSSCVVKKFSLSFYLAKEWRKTMGHECFFSLAITTKLINPGNTFLP